MRTDGIPVRPFAPPVTESHALASCPTVSPIARVSIRKNTPALRTVIHPVSAAATAPTTAPTSSGTGASAVTWIETQPAAYAPDPK
jgi:hypothetical protein